MLVKWITCAVLDRVGFDDGQRGWGALREVPGFLGQCGGWSLSEPDRAHVLGFWAGEASYRAFMAGAHDALAAGQTGSYTDIAVRLLTRRFDIGRPVNRALPDGAAALRLAHCHVHSGQTTHFRAVQACVWNPGMAATPGMSGGVFAQGGETEFLVVSLWSSEETHESYRTERFPELRRRAGAAVDLAEITGDLVAIEPRWTVTPA